MASIMTINFIRVPDHRQHASGKLQDRLAAREPPKTAEGLVLNAKQIRARARRKMKRADILTAQEMEYMYRKPIEEWDLEELAHGRPRNSKGSFSGPKPRWINAEIHEEAMERYTAAVKSDMNATTVDALDTIRHLLNNEEVDQRGRPVVPSSVKLEASKFLIEHVVGKPKQHLLSDVSIKLQGILGQVMANPAQVLLDQSQGGEGYTMGHFPGVTMPLAALTAGEDDDEEWNYAG